LHKVVGQIGEVAVNIELPYPLWPDDVSLVTTRFIKREEGTSYPLVGRAVMEACFQVPLGGYLVTETEAHSIGAVDARMAPEFAEIGWEVEDPILFSGRGGAEEGPPGGDCQIKLVFSLWLMAQQRAGKEQGQANS